MDRKQLADFLRTRRARVTPRDVGLPNNQRRRLPGLRREEVAHLAGISEDYYARLEQSRSPHPSRQVLNALARALMLTTEERAHLFHLAGETPEDATGPRQDVPEGITHLLHGLDATPAFVLDAKYDLLAWNEMVTALYGDLPGGRRNVIRWTFGTDSDLRDYLREDESSVFIRGAVADLRAAVVRYPEDRSVSDLVSEMLACSKQFAALWAKHEVDVQRDSIKHFAHPAVGPIDLRCQMLHIPDRDQRLVIYTAEPGSLDQLALCSLRATTMAHERTIVVGLGQP